MARKRKAKPKKLRELNGMMLQGFSWNLPADGQHWRRLAKMAPRLADLGFTSVWLPPAYKGQAGAEDVGYGVYDLWDLGQFDQRGTVATKYGTRREYLAAIRALQEQHLNVMADIVLNHRMGADGSEAVLATEHDPDDRTQEISDEHEIEAWTRFTFPGRAGALNKFTWDWRCFHGTDWDDRERRTSVWRFHGKSWDDDVSHERGNYDYLMGADVDLNSPRVYRQLAAWGKWYLRLTGADGLRLDAVKHMSKGFYRRWLAEMREATGKELFCVGEYWSRDLAELRGYLGDDEPMSLFDVPLHFHFYQASTTPRDQIDLRRILDDTLVGCDPVHAVTFVDNHDTEPGQSLQSTVQPWFKPIAYAFILLRESGYPCVFFADLFGMPNDSIPMVPSLPLMMEVRRRFAYGIQRDFFAEHDLVGWTREGDSRHPEGVAVVLCTRGASFPMPKDEDERLEPFSELERRPEDGGHLASLSMNVGTAHAGETWTCVLGNADSVEIGPDGQAEFSSDGADVCIYLSQGAASRLDSIPIIV